MNGRAWSDEDLARLRSLYPIHSTRKVAELFDRSVYSVNGAAHTLGLRKTREYLQSPEAGRLRRGDGVGAAFRFSKGHVPANKGLRRPGWSPGRMKETQFKKGQQPPNWKPLGTVLTDSDGYLRVKIAEGGFSQGFGDSSVWAFAHRFVWEETRGPIPPGYVVVFKDGNREHCEIENLECISRADLARRNAMWNRFPPELIEAILLNGAIKRKLRSLQP